MKGNKMNIVKCPKTVTGQHSWSDKVIIDFDFNKAGLLIITEWYKKCSYCGLIDDTKVIMKKKKKKKKKKMVYYHNGKRVSDLDKESLLAIIDDVAEELERYRKASL